MIDNEEMIEILKNERQTYKNLAEIYIKKYNKEVKENKNLQNIIDNALNLLANNKYIDKNMEDFNENLSKLEEGFIKRESELLDILGDE